MMIPAQQDSPSRQSQRTGVASIPAPIGGWNTRDSIAAMKPTDALIMDNVIVRPGQVSLRKGQINYATGFGGVVLSLFTWSGKKFFGANNVGIYEISNPGAIGTASTAVTNGKVQTVNYATAAGQYVACVNGTDNYQYYDGTTWTSVATFTGSGVSTNSLVSIASYKQRLYFLKAGSLDLHFLDAGAITGAGHTFPLGQIATRGGSLVAIQTWSVDGGTGVDDNLVIATSEGEIIIYTGYDPTNVATWTLKGVYFIGKPLGVRSLLKYGGDLVMLTDRGLFPLSKALISSTIDRTSALTDKISSVFQSSAAALFTSFGWEICNFTGQSFLLVNVPTQPVTQFIMDSNSLSWSRFIGYAANCFCTFGQNLYYGGAGVVVQAYTGVTDFGAQIVGTVQPAYNYFAARGSVKKLNLVRPSFSGQGSFPYKLNASTDFDVFGPQSNESFADGGQSTWDAGIWDMATWTADYYLKNDWNTIPAWPFYCVSLGIQFMSMKTTPSLIAIDCAISKGSIGV